MSNNVRSRFYNGFACGVGGGGGDMILLPHQLSACVLSRLPLPKHGGDGYAARCHSAGYRWFGDGYDARCHCTWYHWLADGYIPGCHCTWYHWLADGYIPGCHCTWYHWLADGYIPGCHCTWYHWLADGYIPGCHCTWYHWLADRRNTRCHWLADRRNTRCHWLAQGWVAQGYNAGCNWLEDGCLWVEQEHYAECKWLAGRWVAQGYNACKWLGEKFNPGCQWLAQWCKPACLCLADRCECNWLAGCQGLADEHHGRLPLLAHFFFGGVVYTAQRKCRVNIWVFLSYPGGLNIQSSVWLAEVSNMIEESSELHQNPLQHHAACHYVKDVFECVRQA